MFYFLQNKPDFTMFLQKSELSGSIIKPEMFACNRISIFVKLSLEIFRLVVKPFI